MKTLARPTTIAVLFLTVAALTVAQPAPAHAQSCSGKCVYTQDCVDCGFSAFLRHFCLVDGYTCECAEYRCSSATLILGRTAALTAASARCAAESEAAPVASRIQVKAVKLKARS
jgi:hypothetical protein